MIVAAIVAGLWSAQHWRAHERSGQAETLGQLLASTHTPRTIANPGVDAWLFGLLHDAGEGLAAEEHQAYERLLHTNDAPKLPADIEAVAERLSPPPALEQLPPFDPIMASPPTKSGPGSLRVSGTVAVDEHRLVFTRRGSLEGREAARPIELSYALGHLGALAASLESAPLHIEGASPLIPTPLRPIRIYATLEDGSALSLPLPQSSASALAHERDQLQARPGSPSIGSNSIFTPFDYGRELGGQAHFSGIYPDLAGAGFVATVAVPVRYLEAGLVAIVAIDFIVDLDLEGVLAEVEPTLELALTGVLEPGDSPQWQPWRDLASALLPDSPAGLRREVQLQANREAEENTTVPRGPVVHHRSENERGVLFAVQVKEERWLVGWIEAERDSLPWLPAVAMPVLVLATIVWARRRRRRLEGERDAAEEGLAQGQRILDLLELPCVIVDPHDDVVVACNEAARALGVVVGRVVHEHVIAPDERAQADYDAQQVRGRRRAYGVDLRLGATESRFALICSVALTEALPALDAPANHRLALVWPVEEEQLETQLERVEAFVRQDERNRLAAIINHGADTLARVLSRQLEGEGSEAEDLAAWLADYLLRRLQVSEWVLEHWGEPALTQTECILGPEHLDRALARYEQIFGLVAGDGELRAQLHWDNGTLAQPPPESRVIQARIDWPEEYRLTVPADGLFGYLLGEALINAVRHGPPGFPIELVVDVDRPRPELILTVSNERGEGANQGADQGANAYGGLNIIRELARLSGWTFNVQEGPDTFTLRCACPLTVQRRPEQVD